MCQAAAKEGLTVDVTAVDFKMGGADLLQDKPYLGILKDAQKRDWDGVHGGRLWNILEGKMESSRPGPTAGHGDLRVEHRQCSSTKAGG